MTESTLVRVSLGVTYLRTRGRSSVSRNADTTMKAVTWSQMAPPSRLMIIAAREPAANHRETMVTVEASTIRKITINTSQVIAAQFILLPPFHACLILTQIGRASCRERV